MRLNLYDLLRLQTPLRDGKQGYIQRKFYSGNTFFTPLTKIFVFITKETRLNKN